MGSARQLGSLGAATVALLAIAQCRSSSPPCPVQCGTLCLAANACAGAAACAAGMTCDPCSGQCRASCADGADCLTGAGTCCPSAGVAVCVDTRSDPLHCGGCGQACGAGADACALGRCACGGGAACAAGQRCCDGGCVDDCGACGVSCADLSGTPAPLLQVIPTALSVDDHAGPGTTSNLDGVFDPGEVVLVAPTWSNQGADVAQLDGVLSTSSGYVALQDADASYGPLAGGASAACLVTGNCYQLSLAQSTMVGGGHRDVGVAERVGGAVQTTYALHVGRSFSDVPASTGGYLQIETALHLGLDAGCASDMFCAGDTLTRAQMAVVAARAAAGGDAKIPSAGTIVGYGTYDCAAQGGTSLLADVSPTDPACRHIHYLYARQVDLSCGDQRFCPTDPAPRGSAAYMIAALMVGGPVPQAYADAGSGRSYDCPGGSIYFTDVATGDASCGAAHYLWARGVTAGCGDKLFCPSTTITRLQAVVFAVLGFGLRLYGP